mmetsp:Transcript_5012/g.7039  ORF Transcript_5012/g.7039 Transcript_5012/m.7039 type:complete len:756 (-) Transcript_5012:63-2330(-)
MLSGVRMSIKPKVVVAVQPKFSNKPLKYDYKLPKTVVQQNHLLASRISLRTFATGIAQSRATLVNHANNTTKRSKFHTSKFLLDETAPKTEDVIPESTERVTGNAVKHEFQTETRKLLDIVARSLYSEREVFIRELVSNASDALEKLRYLQASDKQVENADLLLEINIYCDTEKKTLTIQDTGIGMNKDELIKNLGSIGHSGSSEFMKNLKDKSAADIIGQFGVGFYSTFMVSNNVKVFSKSGIPGSKGYCWSSDGTGSYEISEAEGVQRGTKIVVSLNDKSTEFATKENVQRVIKKYSNFVGFPIKVNGKQINTVKALWTLSKSEITEQDHKEFYQFIAHAYDEPQYHLYFQTDSPINIRSLFYIPKQHSEKFGMGRMEPGVNLFSKKVLIKAKAEGLLPDFLRFIKGVVDSEDLPLNISREHLQDSALIKRIGNVVTKRILKWLDDEANKDPEKFNKFFDEFGVFLREGICTDGGYKEDLAKLLRLDSSACEKGALTTFDQYISRMDPEQKEIFYLCVPSRELGLNSPYYEAFKAKNKEVLLLYTALDDFVMNSLGEYKTKKLLSIESSQALQAIKGTEEQQDAQMTAAELKDLTDWMKNVLTGKVTNVTATDRLVGSPAVITEHDSSAFRKMMKYVDPSRAPPMPKQQLEVNPKHPIVQKLNTVRVSKPGLAKVIAEQLYDDALVAAGLLDDARVMVPRLNQILLAALDSSAEDFVTVEEPKPKKKPSISKVQKEDVPEIEIKQERPAKAQV